MREITFNFFIRNVVPDEFSKSVTRAPTLFKPVAATQRVVAGGFDDCWLWSLSIKSDPQSVDMIKSEFTFLRENMSYLELLADRGSIVKSAVTITADYTFNQSGKAFEDQIAAEDILLLGRIGASLSFVIL